MRSNLRHGLRSSLAGRIGLCCAILLAGAAPARADNSRLTPLVRDGQLLVSFVLADGFTDDVRAVIKSGLRTSFVYTVELRMVVPGWMDRTIATTTVSNIAEYDNLTRRHSLQRTIDGRVAENWPGVVEERIVRDFMTTFTRLALFRNARLEPNRDYYVRVRARAYPSNGSFLWPWSTGLLAQAKFTFIP